MLLPGAEYVAKGENGFVHAYISKPVVGSFCWSVEHGEVRMLVPSLEDRFASIPWRESLVKYEPPTIEPPYIVIEHSNTKRKITGPFSICGSYGYLRSISEQIFDETENSGYGWIQIDGGSKAIPNTPPSGWDE
jgi:hypothetical protein